MAGDLETRIDALERAITDGEGDFDDVRAAAETGARLDDLETDLGELQDRVCELEAATQALRGYVGNVRAVNEDVASTADAALEKAETIEAALSAPDPDDSTTDTGNSADQPRTRAPETAGGSDQCEPVAAGQTPDHRDAATGGGNGTTDWSHGRGTDQARRPGESTTPDGGSRPSGSAAGDGDAGRDASTAPRCERCGKPRDGEAPRETADDLGRSDARPANEGVENGTLGATDAGEPDLAGLSEATNGEPLTRGETVAGTDEPGALERIRQLL
jgi:hypothetical protein